MGVTHIFDNHMHHATLRRVGLGFTQILRDGIANNVPETDDPDVGRIASLTLDLDI